MTAVARRAALEALVSAPGIALASPQLLLPAAPYFDLAGEEFGRRLLLTAGTDGAEYCLRPDFTLPIATDWLANGGGEAAVIGYLGPIFRQRDDGPAEFDQAGLELIAPRDPDAALDKVFSFARAALAAYAITGERIRIGGVGLFEAVLAGLDMPVPWRPRIRNRFGHPEAMARLLDRLADPEELPRGKSIARETLVTEITEAMATAGLSLTEGRGPDEIADRYLEQQTLDAAHVPASTIACLRDYLAIAGAAEPALDAVEKFAIEAAVPVEKPLATLRQHLKALGTADVRFEAAFSPRLDYYTGIVFEIAGPGGAILVSGGQYDRLLERLGATQRVAASGCAVWVDRLEAEAEPS